MTSHRDSRRRLIPFSVGLEHKLAKKWVLDAQYDHQISDSNVPGTYTTDNIFSVGLRYGY
jgi:predicted porin